MEHEVLLIYKARDGVLKRDEVYVDKVSLYQNSCETIVPAKRLQIVVPTAPPSEPLQVSIRGPKVNTMADWNTRTGYLLDEGTVLSTTLGIQYISILVAV